MAPVQTLVPIGNVVNESVPFGQIGIGEAVIATPDRSMCRMALSISTDHTVSHSGYVDGYQFFMAG